MSKIYPLSLDPSYCQHWGLQEAIRELYQNSLDQSNSYVDYNEQEETLIIGNTNAQIPTKYLLMGSGSKKEGGYIGVYGEGSKIAWLILARLGHKVTIKNGDKLWIPYVDHNEMFDTLMLHVLEDDLPDNNDVEYIIEGITAEDYAETVSRCLYLQDDLDIVTETEYGTVLNKLDDQAKLFCSGLYVCDLDTDYSYDIPSKYLKLNRDRDLPPNWDLKTCIQKIWNESENKELAADLMYNDAEDAYTFNYNTHLNRSSLYDACYNKAVQEYGDNVALANDDDEKQELYDEGYRNIVVTGKSEFNDMVRRSALYKQNVVPEEDELEEFTPEEVLEKYLNIHNSDMSDKASEDFQKILELFIDKGCEWSYNNKVTEDDLEFLNKQED